MGGGAAKGLIELARGAWRLGRGAWRWGTRVVGRVAGAAGRGVGAGARGIGVARRGIGTARRTISRIIGRTERAFNSLRGVRKAKIVARKFGRTKPGRALKWTGRKIYRNKGKIALGAYGWMMGKSLLGGGGGNIGSPMIDALQSLDEGGEGGGGDGSGGSTGGYGGGGYGSSDGSDGGIIGPTVGDVSGGMFDGQDDGSGDDGSSSILGGPSGSGGGEGGGGFDSGSSGAGGGASDGLSSDAQVGILAQILRVLQQSLAVQNETSSKASNIQSSVSNVNGSISNLTGSVSSDIASVSSSISDLGSDIIPEVKEAKAAISGLDASLSTANQPVIESLENISSIVSETPDQISDSISDITSESSSQTQDLLSDIQETLESTNETLRKVADDAAEMRVALNPEFKKDAFGGGAGGLLGALAGSGLGFGGGDLSSLAALIAGGVATAVAGLAGGQRQQQEQQKQQQEQETQEQKDDDPLWANPAITAEAKTATEEYGNMPKLSINGVLNALTGKDLGVAGDIADVGVNLIPGVGSVIAAYDAVRNTADMVSDLKRGKWLSALGNGASALMNAVFVIPGVGNIGKGIIKTGKAIRGVRGGARAAKALTRHGKGAANAGIGLVAGLSAIGATAAASRIAPAAGRNIGEKTDLDDITSEWESQDGNRIANNWLGEGEKTERLDAERKRKIDNNYSFWKTKTSPIDSSIAKANEFASFVKSNAEELDNDCVDPSNPDEYDVDKSKHADKLVDGYQSLMGAPLGLALDDSLSDEQYAEKLDELIKPFAEMAVTPFGWSMVRRGLNSEATTSLLISSIGSDTSVPENIKQQRKERFVYAIGALKNMLGKVPRPAPKKFRQLAKQTNETSANIVARVSSESGQIETEEESQNSEIVGTVSGINLKGEMIEDRMSSMFGQAKDDVSRAGKDAMIAAYGGGRAGKKKARAERDQNIEKATKGASLAHEYNSLSVAGRLKWAERWTGQDDKDKYKKFLSENINPAIESANRISQTLNPAILDEAIDGSGFILQNSDLPKGFIDELNTHQRRLDNAIIGASQTSTDVTADLLNEVKFDEFVKASTQSTPLGRLFYNRLIFANTELPKYFKQDQLDKFNKNAPFVNAYIDSYIPKIAITKKTAIESPKEALGEEVQATAEAVATESAAAESTAAESAVAESIAEETESTTASIEPTVSTGVGTESENSQIVPENTESPSTSTSDMVVDQSESTPTITAEHSDSAQLDITPQHSIVSPETDKDATAESLEMLASPLQTSNDNERLVITLLQNIIEIIKPNNQPIPEFPPQFKMDGQYIT